MKKIMVFLGGYLPGRKYGGPVTSIKNFSDYLGDLYDILIVCSNHDLGEKDPYENIDDGWNCVGNAKVLYLPDSKIKYKNISELLKNEKPDMLYCSGIMYIKVNYGIFKAAKKLNIPVLLAPRGDICVNAINIKRWKKIPFLKLAKTLGIFDGIVFHATMQEEKDNLKKYLGIDESRVFLLPNFPEKTEAKQRNEKEAGRIRIVFLSRIQSKKNLLDAIKAVNRLGCKAVFDIYGPIEEESYMELCEAEMMKAPSNVEISYKGALIPGEASGIFADYDCFLFPTKTENYGHVIAEALLQNCPIVISKGTTPWDGIHNKAGFCVELGNITGFTDALEKIAEMDSEDYAALTHNVEKYRKSNLNTDGLRENYIKILEEIT